jgi:hypothetical protein
MSPASHAAPHDGPSVHAAAGAAFAAGAGGAEGAGAGSSLAGVGAGVEDGLGPPPHAIVMMMKSTDARYTE